jgi:GNAT superfamily N-acetyltransferase
MQTNGASNVLTLQPRLHHASAIRADPTLTQTITNLVNDGYRYMSPINAVNWSHCPRERLHSSSAIHELLGSDGLFAVIYDEGTPIACAAATRWTGGFKEHGVFDEEGWEIVTVTARKEWLKRGLAGACVDALVTELVRQVRQNEKRDKGMKLQLWVQCVECLYGEFWRKKGWVEERAYVKPAGDFGSKMGYRLLVMLQEFGVEH